ncbi:MAG: orotate phosphoribosyltransferase [Alphaproteobacteria bacterium]
MLTHTQIWNAIDALAAAKGYSASGLAKQAGLDPTSFNKSKRHSPDGKPRWPSTESISKILDVTDMSMEGFVKLIGDGVPRFTSLSRKEMALDAAKILIETESVLFNAKEPFTLKSGRQSPVYIDCRRLISFPAERDRLMDYGAQILTDEVGADNIDVMAGGETAGIPYGAYLSDRLKKSMIYVRKEPKGYGRMAQIEGALSDKGKPKAVLIEDLQTDGGSKKIFIDALRDAGAEVKHTFVVFHYGIFKASEKNMKSMGVKLHSIATWWDVLAAAKEHGYFDDETLASVEAFLTAPDKWSA